MEHEYSDRELLLMYREFIKRTWAASFYSPESFYFPDAAAVARFRRWITENYEPEHRVLEDYEREMLRLFREAK